MDAGNLDRRIVIEYTSTGQDDYGAPVQSWTELATVWAEVTDLSPSRGAEALQQGLQVARNATRIRYRYRADVTSAMRIRELGAADATVRTLQIIAGPAEIGRQEFSEVLCERYSS